MTLSTQPRTTDSDRMLLLRLLARIQSFPLSDPANDITAAGIETKNRLLVKILNAFIHLAS